MAIPQQPQQQAVQTPAPQIPQSNDEAIGDFARSFLGDLQQNDDPDQRDPEPQAHEEDAPLQDTETQEAETQEAETPALPEVPLVEVDIDGEKFTIPEKVKHRVMADKDYRQKTMEVSATKKQLETLIATATQAAQQASQLAPYNAQLFQMENQAQFLNQRLRSPELQQDPVEFNRVQGELAILLHSKDRFAQGLQQEVSKLEAQRHQVRVNQLAMEAPKLLEEFPDLAKQESKTKLTQYVQEAGLPPEAIDFLNFSAPGIKLAWKAHQYDVMVADQAKAKAKLNEKTKGLPAATQSSRAPDQGAKDKQLREGWKKRGGSISDPAFTEILRSQIRRK